MTLDEDRAERVKRKADMMLRTYRIATADTWQVQPIVMAPVLSLFAAEFIRLEDEIRALKDEVRLAASGLRERA